MAAPPQAIIASHIVTEEDGGPPNEIGATWQAIHDDEGHDSSLVYYMANACHIAFTIASKRQVLDLWPSAELFLEDIDANIPYPVEGNEVVVRFFTGRDGLFFRGISRSFYNTCFEDVKNSKVQDFIKR